MYGIIVTGHGHFATGLQSSLELIAGGKDTVLFVDFEAQDSVEDLREKLKAAIDSLEVDGILVMSDLAGGSPFKTAVELSVEEKKDIMVIAGTNLPMIIELSMTKDFMSSLEELTNSSLNVGKENIVKYEFIARQETIDEDGI